MARSFCSSRGQPFSLRAVAPALMHFRTPCASMPSFSSLPPPTLFSERVPPRLVIRHRCTTTVARSNRRPWPHFHLPSSSCSFLFCLLLLFRRLSSFYHLRVLSLSPFSPPPLLCLSMRPAFPLRVSVHIHMRWSPRHLAPGPILRPFSRGCSSVFGIPPLLARACQRSGCRASPREEEDSRLLSPLPAPSVLSLLPLSLCPHQSNLQSFVRPLGPVCPR